jgi:uncharacterized protein
MAGEAQGASDRRFRVRSDRSSWGNGWAGTMAERDGDIPELDAHRAASVAELAACFSRSNESGGANASVEHVETHLSHVFVGSEFVYKLLKPVQFAFVDFSTIERRREECQAEVELNRPLAGDVYISALPVKRLPNGDVAVSERASEVGLGTVVDWAVKMRRLPARQTLDALACRGEASAGHIEQVVTLLAQHYSTAKRPAITAAKYLAAIERHVRDNLAELSRGEHALPHALTDRVHARQLTTLALYRGDFEKRVDNGRVVLGHGDLRPEHVYFVPEPVVIDCLAFSDELRTLDVADEIAFLAIELRRLGSNALADRLIHAFGEHTTDHPPARLWAFYQAYRACVRAKVGVLRAAQIGEPQRTAQRVAARMNLELAEAVSRRFSKPFCVVVRGLSGTGKSNLAAALAEKLGIAHLQTDQVRKQLFPSANSTGYGQGCYTSAAKRIVYDAMRAQACERLAEGQSVILDGTFLSAAARTCVGDMAARYHLPALVLECHCPADVAEQRLAARAAEGKSLSDANPATLQRQMEEEEPSPPGLKSIRVETTAVLSRQLEESCRAIREMLDASTARTGDA